MSRHDRRRLSDDYQIVDVLGRGGFSVVRKGISKSTGEMSQVAIKTLRRFGYMPPGSKPKNDGLDSINTWNKASISDALLTNEILVMRRIVEKVSPHNNVLNLYDVYDDSDGVHLVLELCHGGELFDRIVTHDRYSEFEAAVVIRQIASGLEALHKANIIHRDLKPENCLFLDRNMSHLKIMDFGLSSVEDHSDPIVALFGSIDYVSPEALSRHQVSAASDMWSLGVILYILLSGCPPFAAATNREKQQRILNGDFSFEDPTWKTISLSAKDLISRLLSVEPYKRPTATDLLKHPWVIGDSAKQDLMVPEVVTKLQKFNARRKLRAAAIASVLSSKVALRTKKLKSLLGSHDLTPEELDNLHLHFKRICSNGENATLSEFEEVLKAMKMNSLIPLASRVFDLFDNNRDGTVDMREILCGLSSLKNSRGDEALRLCFQMYDTDRSGYISKEELASMLRALPEDCLPADIAEPTCPFVAPMASSAQDEAPRSPVYEAIHPPQETQENEKRYSSPAGGVNIARAEAEFAELSKELSRTSRVSRQLSRVNTHQSKTNQNITDLEKASQSDGSSEEPFDLEKTLRGNREEEDAAGIKSKRIGIVWDGLTVSGIGGVKNYIKTFPWAFVSFFNVVETAMNIFGVGKKGREFDILKDFRGVVKPGEMVLVLGRPGSGCTTFLKVISNQRYGYTKVDGNVQYGPFDAAFFEKRYRGEAVYCEEDENHHPTLTVGQTLDFALETKVPGKRPAGLSRREFKDKVIDLMLKMFNIEHTRNTIVGNPFVRGISGGERKRVSIAETMVTGASVMSWDNSTRGLDASTAVDYARSLRVLTNIYKTSTFVSLYQASENIFEVFDKVLVIDSGRQVYFGPAKEARAYFEGLGFLEKPRQTTPDYLTGCTDPFEREYQPGRSPDNVPNSPDQLAEAFNKSEIAARLDQEMNEYRAKMEEEKHVYEDFVTAVKDSKRHASAKSVYAIPFYLQLWALAQRQFLLKWQNKFDLVVGWFTSISIAIVIGTVWLNLPKTSDGAFTRGGVLFIALLFNAFQAFSELASTMIGRPIVNKHRAFTFHRPSALWIAQIGVDLLFASAQIFVFSVIVYFMTGLVRDAGAFFTFFLVIVTGYLGMTLFFRTVGCLCPDFDVAIRLAATIITLFVLTSGYIIQWQSEQVWLRWIFYVNALGLGFSALMMNEFKGLDLTCSGTSLIPFGPGYTDINNQVCTLAGSKSGSTAVAGSDYIKMGFSYDPKDLWRNWGIMVVLIVGFLIANAFLGEFVKWGAGGRTVTFFAKENEERKKLNQELQARRDRRNRKVLEKEAGEGLKIMSKSVLTWEDLCYDVPVPSGQLRLLNNIYGYVKPGTLTALMGASGAGKTTLLDVLAARKNIGVITGQELVDGKPPGIAFQRGTSYAEQLDVHEPATTVREALRFSADLRQPYETPQEEKYAYVEEVISLLEMEDIADAIIGDPESGLAVEQRKRVTIGVELAAKPELLLFLDEPTSGLDSQSAFNIVRFLRKLAAAGQAILCTIHQPNSALFENFDRLLLLQRGGRCVYFGDIGKDASVLLDYFHRNGADCPPSANPAEWMLDAIGAGQAPRIGNKDWGDIWQESPELAETKAEIIRIKETRIAEVGSAEPVEQKEYATPMWHQIKLVNKRMNLSFWRSPNYGFTRLFNHVIIALLTGLMYLNLDNSRSSLQYRVFIIFQVTVLPALILAQVQPKYAMARMIAYREQAAKAYKMFPFALSMVVAEMPYSVLCSVAFFLPLYYIPGLNSESSRAGYQFFMIFITEIFSVTLAQMIAALTPSPFIAALVNPFVIIIFSLFCGVTIPKPQIPGFWRAWLYQLDPFTRLIGGMLVTELHDQKVTCSSQEYNRFTAPSGQDCGSYMSDFFSMGAPGYLKNNGTSNCEYCAFKVGDEFFSPLGYEFAHRWRDLGIFAAFIASNLIILFMAARYLNFNRR